MEIIKTGIDSLSVLKPKVFGDKRGYFQETWNRSVFEEKGILNDFVQDNESKSKKGVLRGLHFQLPPYSQAKLVRVIKGSVLDVAVDIRKKSPTYGKYFKKILSEENKLMMIIPRGIAHGFVTLEDETIFVYKCDNFYMPEYESGLLWNDKQINIDWGINNPLVSERDEKWGCLADFDSPF